MSRPRVAGVHEALRETVPFGVAAVAPAGTVGTVGTVGTGSVAVVPVEAVAHGGGRCNQADVGGGAGAALPVAMAAWGDRESDEGVQGWKGGQKMKQEREVQREVVRREVQRVHADAEVQQENTVASASASAVLAAPAALVEDVPVVEVTGGFNVVAASAFLQSRFDLHRSSAWCMGAKGEGRGRGGSDHRRGRPSGRKGGGS